MVGYDLFWYLYDLLVCRVQYIFLNICIILAVLSRNGILFFLLMKAHTQRILLFRLISFVLFQNSFFFPGLSYRALFGIFLIQFPIPNEWHQGAHNAL